MSYRANTIFDFNVSYDVREYDPDKIINMLIEFALNNGFDIGIEPVETYETPEI